SLPPRRCRRPAPGRPERPGSRARQPPRVPRQPHRVVGTNGRPPRAVVNGVWEAGRGTPAAQAGPRGAPAGRAAPGPAPPPPGRPGAAGVVVPVAVVLDAAGALVTGRRAGHLRR